MKKYTFGIFCLEAALLFLNFAAAAAVIPSIAADFALSQFVVGKIVWMYMLPYGLAAFFYGPLVRSFDARKVELICMLLFSLANLMAGFSRDISTLFVARFLAGIFGASVIPLGMILIAKHINQNKRGGYIGILFGSTIVSSLLGSFLSGFIHWRLIFIIPGVLGLILWVFMYIYLPTFKENLVRFRFGYLEAFKNKRFFCIFVYIFLISMIYHGVQQWLGVYFSTQRFLSQLTISMLITLAGVSGIFGELYGGYLADKINRAAVVNLGIIAMLLCILLLLLKLPLILLAGAMILWGIGWTFNHVGLATMLTDLPQALLNEGASLNSGIRFIAGGLGAGLGGLMMQRSFSLAFIVFGSMLIMLLSLEGVFKFNHKEA